MAAGVALGVGAVVDATCACAEVDVRQKESTRKAITGRRCTRAKRCIAIVYSGPRANRERSDSSGACQLPVRRLSRIYRNASYLLYIYFNRGSDVRPWRSPPARTGLPSRKLMTIQTRLVTALLLPLLCGPAALSQEPSTPPGSDKIYLDVVVTPKSGPPVSGLRQQDLTILDNKAPRPITSFRAMGAADVHVEVVVV